MNAASDSPVPREVDGFVSYSRADVSRVVPVIEAMRGQGRTLWLDSADIAAGSIWREELRRAIEAARAVICFVSSQWTASVECRAELDYAISLGKRLVPIVMERVDLAAMPPELRAVQWIDVGQRDASNLAAAAGAAIDVDSERVRDHTFWLAQALRWESTGRQRSALARGRSLLAAEAWLQRSGRDPVPTPLQVGFITASRRAERRRGRIQLALALTAFVVAAILTTIAVIQRNTATRERNTARSRALAVASTGQLGRDPELSLLLARAAWQSAHTNEAVSAMRAAVDASLVRLSVHRNTPIVATMGVGHVIVTATSSGQLSSWSAWTGRVLDNAQLGARLLRLYRDRVGNAGVALMQGDRADVISVDGNGRLTVRSPLTGVTAANLSSSGRIVVIGRDDGTVVRSVNGGPFTPVVVVNTDEKPAAVAVSDDGAVVAVGTALRNFHPQVPVLRRTGGRLYLVAGGRSQLASTAFTPIEQVALDDVGATVLAAAADGAGLVANVSTGRRVLTIQHAYLADLDPMGHYAAISTIEGATQLGSISTGQWHPLSQRSAPLLDLRFSADGQRVAGASRGGPGYLWTTVHPRLVASLLGSSGSMASIFVESGDTRVVSGHNNGDAHVWALPSAPVVVRFGRPNENGTTGIGINSVSLSPDGAYIVTSADNASVQTWGVDGRPRCLAQGELSSRAHCPITLAAVARMGDAIGINALAQFSPDGRQLAVEASNGGVWAFRTSKIPSAIWHASPTSATFAGGVLAYSPDGRQLLVQNGTVAPRILDAVTGRTIARLQTPSSTSYVGAWASNNEIVIGDAQGQVDSYDSFGDQRRALARLGDAVLAVAASPDGRTIAVTAGPTVELLDATTGARKLTLDGDTQAVNALAYSRDGSYLVSGSADGTARLWDPRTGTTLTQINEPGSQVTAVAYDSAARLLIAGGRNSAMYLSHCGVCISADALAHLAATRTTRPFTSAERAEFGVGSLLK